mgnify:CR=1 FL=1
MSRTPFSEGHNLSVPLREGRYYVPLRDRIEHLPLILAGPILRQTDSNAVTVWVALKAPREVTLKVYATGANGSILKHLLLEGTSSTVALGKHLHVIAVTARPINAGEGERRRAGGAGEAGGEEEQREQREHIFCASSAPSTTSSSLKPGQLYAYDLSFGSDEQNLAQALNSETVPTVTVSYFEHQLPTFAMPPEDLNNLRLAHGSCRKLHGGGHDALPILDDLIEHYAKEPNSRLHQLFFTGDQIYGDDVADSLLWMATEIGDTLLGWEEHLPLHQTPTASYKFKKPRELKPGQRTDIARDCGGLTAMLLNTPHEAKSHLFSLGEYFATYLLVWSPVLWPGGIPEGKAVRKDAKQIKRWDSEARHLKRCRKQLWKVRRAMANVPIYMVCDDHDISDDWYLNRAWCNSVLGKPLGRRVVQNGLLAYAVFQAWGNTPDQFQERQPGGNLLNAAAMWSASGGTDESALEDVAKCLGLPPMEPKTGLPKFKRDQDVLILDRDYPDGTLPVEWHYTVRSLKHEVIVLDTRTWRGYPFGQEGEIAPPRLLCPTAFEKQIQKPLEFTDGLKHAGESDIELTFVVVPTNLVSLRIIDIVQQWELEKGSVFSSDVGDSWNLNEVALSKLLAELFKRRQQVVVLSGDIHFSGAIRLSYWSRRHFEAADEESDTPFVEIQNQAGQACGHHLYKNRRVLAQLTASAFKNSELKTYIVHTKVKSLAPERPQDWAGWNEPPQLVEIQTTPATVRVLDVEMPATTPVVREILGVRGNWDMAWEIALKDGNSLPDWQYHIEWLKRENVRIAPWQGKRLSSTPFPSENQTGWLAALKNLVSMLWQNRWFQEGEEVIGHSNFGVISLEWFPNEDVRTVIQDNYWRPPWKANTVVYSRYCVPLHIEEPPRLLKVITP